MLFLSNLLSKYRAISNILICLGVLTISACGGSSNSHSTEPEPTPAPEPVLTDYQAIIDNSVTGALPGVILSIDGPTTNFLGSAGLADIESNTPIKTSDVIPNGSAGKKATALLVSLLHEQGMLDIDLTIDHYLSAELLEQIEFSQQMTLRQLLNHTAGIYDYLDEASADDWFNAIMTDPNSIKTDEFALQFALNQPGYFMPGEGFEYSNTGYLLAGLIMDQVLGEHHYRTMRTLIFEPLDLQSTYYNGLEKDRGEIISGYFDDEGTLLNTKPVYQNIGVADAPLVSSASDMSKLIRAIITNKELISDASRQLLIGSQNLNQLSDNLFYGMGMFKEVINGKTIYHHGGDEPGYMTSNLYIEETDTSMTLLINCNLYEACQQQGQQLIDTILISLL